MACGNTMRGNTCNLEEWEILIAHKENNFSHGGGKILEEVPQRGCGISIRGGVQEVQDCWMWPFGNLL